MQLNHFLFVDDLIVCSKADNFSAIWLKHHLDSSAIVFGLCINANKSRMFISGVNSEKSAFILSALGFQEGHLPMKYLGVPLISSRLYIADCSPILDRVKQRISSWTNIHLSFAGRCQLIQSVLLNLQVFWCSIFILHVKILATIESYCRNFLWTGFWDRKGIVPVAWQNLCTPRVEGGLGFKQIKIWNIAAMSNYFMENSFNCCRSMGFMDQTKSKWGKYTECT